jgi:hypothetical protein
MAYEELKSSGITAKTPENIMLGAGTIHKGLAFADGKWNFEESLIGATSGGSKFSIVPEFTDIEVDGALVKVKGFTVKTGETATMEVNFTELSTDLIKAATLGATGTSEDKTLDVVVPKADIAVGDYWGNVAFVGKTLEGKPVIAILENALVTSGFETEGKNKESATGAYTFTCHADSAADSFDVLPWKIYYPVATV